MKTFRKNIQNIIYLFRPFWKYNKLEILFYILIGAVISTVAVTTSALYQQTIITALSQEEGLGYILGTALWMSVLIYLPQMISDIFDNLVSVLTMEKTEARIKEEIYRKSRCTDYQYFDTPEFYNNYTWTIEERAGKASSARQLVLRLFSLTVTIFSMAGVIAAQDIVVLLVTVAALALNLLIGLRANQWAYRRQEEQLVPRRKLFYVNRMFYVKDCASEIKTTNVGEKLLREYKKAYAEIFESIKKYKGRFALYSVFRYILIFMVHVSVAVYLSSRVMEGEILIGSFVGLMTASTILKNHLSQLFDFVKSGNMLSYYAERLKAFEQLVSPIENEMAEGRACNKSHEAATIDTSEPFEIEFQDVSFSYPGSEFRISNLNLTIRSGQKIAVVGENGGGKTTLTKLLLRLYDVDSGRILFYGKDIREYDVQELRSCIGVAFQNTHVYAMSMRDNLTLYTDKAQKEELEAVSRLFGLDKVLEKAKSDLDSPMTREFDGAGILLSGGEAQKLALARLFLKEFGLLILDEPSAALDPAAEYELNKLLFTRASSNTAIMISHRLSSVRDADCIYLLHNGTVAEKGTHEELMAEKRLYFDLFTKQQEYYVK